MICDNCQMYTAIISFESSKAGYYLNLCLYCAQAAVQIGLSPAADTRAIEGLLRMPDSFDAAHLPAPRYTTLPICSKCGLEIYAGDQVVQQGGPHVACRRQLNTVNNMSWICCQCGEPANAGTICRCGLPW